MSRLCSTSNEPPLHERPAFAAVRTGRARPTGVPCRERTSSGRARIDAAVRRRNAASMSRRIARTRGDVVIRRIAAQSRESRPDHLPLPYSFRASSYPLPEAHTSAIVGQRRDRQPLHHIGAAAVNTTHVSRPPRAATIPILSTEPLHPAPRQVAGPPRRSHRRLAPAAESRIASRCHCRPRFPSATTNPRDRIPPTARPAPRPMPAPIAALRCHRHAESRAIAVRIVGWSSLVTRRRQSRIR